MEPKPKQNADVKKPSEVDKMLGDFFTGKEAAEKGTTETPTPPDSGPTPKAEEAIPAPPTAESTDESIETLKAELTTTKQQVVDLSAVLTEAQKALTVQNNDSWKHKFDVLDGKIKKLGPESKEQKERIKELETELAAAKAEKPAEATTETVTDFDKKMGESWGVEPAEIAAFRQSIIDSVPKPVAEPKAAPAKAPDVPEEEPVAEPSAPTQPAQNTDTDQATKAFLTLLDVKAKGWQEIRTKPEFAEFCNTRPGGELGPTYLEYLKYADANLDADTTARVYNAFMKTAKPAEAPHEAPKKPSREAADSRSKGGDGAPVAVETWTPEKIEQFSNDVNSGKIKVGSEEYKKLRASYDNWMNNIKVAG